MLYKLDQTIKWIKDWPTAAERIRRDNLITPGSIIHFKSNKKPAVLIRHDQYGGSIVCYADSGPITTGRSSVIVPKDQSIAKQFKPMRLWLPYGKSTFSNGEQVLFNRDYIPLWTKLQNGKVVPALPNRRNEKGVDEFFFDDGSAPWHNNKNTKAQCIKALNEWGVEHQTPELMEILREAVASGDVSLLGKNRINRLPK